jgi:hypothetical protein
MLSTDEYISRFGCCIHLLLVEVLLIAYVVSHRHEGVVHNLELRLL